MKESFGVRFTRLRKEKGLTQDDIARKINISPQAVSKWENDVSSPDISILNDLSDILGVTLDELLGKETENKIELLPEDQRKDINKMLLKINVLSHDGDKVKVNIPVSILKICLESGMAMPQINGNDALKNIDFKEIFSLIEQGVIGRLVEVESKDGDTVYISVE